ncbi:LysR family transcriptional regulator [Rhodoferax saidenbachensis]|uniref:DNA-binding transcriptional LysR family regulator n=1 Tax=Rhodoferax saidenbachensis TaxID=1484693 RepID=A0ABU1ZRT6_9BURK|nr:LysR family transcriptional regulator [Rhodoferax saidenbachensis]MDR7308234.1 DNA-binding transcriptional LysR family regulator [Rhodoferax saidenbachensis]
MDLLQSMRIFQCVVDEGGFAAAARKLDITPAVVTRQIQDLEQSLGARLLHRTTRRMSLTQVGEGYLARLRMILLEIGEAEDQVRAYSSEISGHLRVVTTSLVAVNLLAPCVADFQRQHPGVQVEINTSDRPAQELHQFDLSIVRQDENLDADAVVRPVLDMPYVLCGSTSYLQTHGVPMVPEDLSSHRMVRLRTLGARPQTIHLVNPMEGGRSIAVAPDWSVMSNDDETAYQAALAGAGLTLLPELALTARPHGSQLRRVLAPWVSADGLKLVATLPSRRFLPSRTRAFLEFFVQHVQQVAAKDGAAQGT